MILQIANGTFDQNNLDSPLQITAADINQDGAVTTLDAWLLLRHIVGLSVDTVGLVGFVDADQDLSGITVDNTQPDDLDLITAVSDLPTDLTVFIIGDVDGSYRPDPSDPSP